jgi:hypothetical protein
VAEPVEPTRWSVRAARRDELRLLVEIERAVGESFRSLGMDLVADDESGSATALAPYAASGRAPSLRPAPTTDRSATSCST